VVLATKPKALASRYAVVVDKTLENDILLAKLGSALLLTAKTHLR